MAFSHNDMQNKAQAVTVHVHAPEYSGFTHTIKSRFFHFEGSGAGVRTHFGMSPKELNALLIKFHKNFLSNEEKINKERVEVKFPEEVLNKLTLCIQEVQDIATKHKAGHMFMSDDNMAVALHETGHIPLILSKATPAQQYGRSTRSIGTGELAEYFGRFPGARGQAVEYLVKQAMMQKIAQLYKETSDIRNTLEKQPEYYPCTRLMTALENEVFKKNEETMPAEYVQFDLYSAFVEKLYKLICQINVKNDPEILGELVKRLLESINYKNDSFTTVDVQKTISDQIYVFLDGFLKAKGFGGDNLRITKELDVILQDVLPIAAYLNSEFNPYAKAGVFGEVVESAFHKKALAAYKQHESKEHVYIYQAREYVYDYTPRTERFNLDQIDRLVFGPEEEAPAQAATSSSFLSSFNRALSAISSGSTVVTAASSQSAQRRQQLALPATEEQKMLMPAESELNLRPR